MKKISLVIVIFLLIISTALIKNSAKKNEDKIFTVKENLRFLNSKFKKIKLEYDYLSSPDKLLEYQALYFDDELIKKDIQSLKKIEIINDKIAISSFNLNKN
ncbi:cell division protein FtsL [Candidatus Pelagibacter bacterium]|nr:cell division protein FtsL [Candidatus Pelagibacter bacterium]